MGFPREEHWSGLPFSSSRGSSRPRDQTRVSCIAGGFFTCWAIRETLSLVQSWNPEPIAWCHNYPPVSFFSKFLFFFCTSSASWIVALLVFILTFDLAGPPELIFPSSRPQVFVAANSLQLCLTLCDPIDSSPPGSPVPRILQARILEWVAIFFPIEWKWKMKVKLLSSVRLLATPWTAAYQAPPSMGFSRQEYWSGVPLPSPQVFVTWLQNKCHLHNFINFSGSHFLVVYGFTIFQACIYMILIS